MYLDNFYEINTYKGRLLVFIENNTFYEIKWVFIRSNKQTWRLLGQLGDTYNCKYIYNFLKFVYFFWFVNKKTRLGCIIFKRRELKNLVTHHY